MFLYQTTYTRYSVKGINSFQRPQGIQAAAKHKVYINKACRKPPREGGEYGSNPGYEFRPTQTIDTKPHNSIEATKAAAFSDRGLMAHLN